MDATEARRSKLEDQTGNISQKAGKGKEINIIKQQLWDIQDTENI